MPDVLHHPLASLDDTARLAQALAFAFQRTKAHVLLLRGELGLGKTTLAALFTRNFPGGEEAETASPSFTICNIYSTSPEIHHYDLYRLTPGIMDDGLAESFESPRVITVVEWAERIADNDLPEDALCCGLYLDGTGSRFAAISHLGPEGSRALAVAASCLCGSQAEC